MNELVQPPDQGEPIDAAGSRIIPPHQQTAPAVTGNIDKEKDTMGEAKRRKEQLGSEYGRGIPPILAEAMQKISNLIEVADSEEKMEKGATLATAGEKMAAAIVDFGHGAIDAVDERIAWHICWAFSDEPFWKAMINGLIARQPAQQPHEGENDYRDRVVDALQDVVRRLEDLVGRVDLIGKPTANSKMTGYTFSNIPIGNRTVERRVLCFTAEGAKQIMNRMVDDFRSGELSP